jgi:hypothetical protein
VILVFHLFFRTALPVMDRHPVERMERLGKIVQDLRVPAVREPESLNERIGEYGDPYSTCVWIKGGNLVHDGQDRCGIIVHRAVNHLALIGDGRHPFGDSLF